MGHARMAARLLAMGLDATDAWNEDGATPLHAAALAGSLECAELLLKSGVFACVCVQDGGGGRWRRALGARTGWRWRGGCP